MTPELKPCPFCGHRVQIDDPEAFQRRRGFCVECGECNLQMWSWQAETPRQLAERWNARFPPQSKMLARSGARQI